MLVRHNAYIICLSVLSLALTSCIDSDNLAGRGKVATTAPTPPEVIAINPPINFSGVESVTPVAHDKMLLSFSAGSGGSGSLSYRVYTNDNFAIPVALTNLYFGENGKLNAVHGGLAAGSNYKFVVRAYDGHEEDTNKVEKTGATLSYTTPDFDGIASLQPPPGIPGKTSLTASWTAAIPLSGTSISSYRIYVRTASGTYNFNTPAVTAVAPATQADITGLALGTKYYVTVRAKDSNGHEEKNLFEMAAFTNVAQSISFLGALSALPSSGVSGFTSVDLNWIAAAGDFTQYQVFYSTSDPSSLALNDPFWSSPNNLVTSTSATGFSVSGLTANTTYYFVVRAHDAGGGLTDGNRTAISTVTTPPAPTFAGATNATIPAGLAGATSVTVNWNAATGAFNQYKIYRKTGGGTYNYAAAGPPDLAGTVGSSATSFTVTGLSTGTQYCFVARASNSAPALTETNTREVCGTPIVAPPSFGGITSCIPTNSTTITLNWTGASGVFDDYRVWRQPGSTLDISDATTANNITGASNTSYPVTGLNPATNYTFIAKAHYSSAGNGPSSMDNNTVYVSCSTPSTSLSFEVYPNYRGSSNNFFQATKVCNRDGTGNLVTTPINITLARASGTGTLGGTLTRTTSGGCALFDDLTYDVTETVQFMASSAGYTSVFTPFIVLPAPDPVPAGSCLAAGGGWSTSFGGCYNSNISLVVSGISPTTMSSTNASGTEAHWNPASDLSDTDLHDWPIAGGKDGNSDGIPDQYDATSPYFTEGTKGLNSGYCHTLVEGGYQDWRLPTYLEIQNLFAQGAVTKAKVLNANYWIGYDNNGAVGTATYGNPGTGAKVDNQAATTSVFCVREPETSFAPPQIYTAFTATALNYAAIRLAWTEPASGTFSGYYLYYAIDPAMPNVGGAPQLKIKKGTTSYDMQGLQPNTKYNILMRTVWTNHNPIISDGNSTVYDATTPVKPASHILKLESVPLFRSNTNLFYQGLKVCNRDDFNVLQTTYPIAITLTLNSGAGTLGGTLTKIANNGCVEFDNLTYNVTETIGLTASAPGFAPVNSPALPLPAADGALPVGFCAGTTTNWSTKYGGCYNKVLGLVVGKKSAAAMAPSGAFWEGKADLSDIDLHDWPVAGGNDGDADGIPDHYDTLSSFKHEALQNGSGYCHGLSEGGYQDWRLFMQPEFDLLTASHAFGSYITGAVNLQPWTGYDVSAAVGTATSTYIDAAGNRGWPWNNTSVVVFCGRTAEANFWPPQAPTGFGGVGNGAGQIDLSWTPPTTGNYSGFYIYYSISPANPDLSGAPQVTVKKGLSAKSITGLASGSTYKFVIRSAYTNRDPAVTDPNTTTISVLAP